MAEANLVKGDLLEILAKISPRAVEDKWRHKLAVATRMWEPGLFKASC
jgi:replication fork protection complex subunit Tof1/Swi1